MAEIEIKNLSFRYPTRDRLALSDINLTVRSGEFVLICGKSGCGKSTLLRQLKPILSPYGERSGAVLYDGVDCKALSQREQSEQIGFVLQNPENGIVCDKVWHELAFAQESLGYLQGEISVKVAEMASFFGIQNYYYKDVKDLSGGQKQLVNLAAVMTLSPSTLILDEPTSLLDPIAAYDFCRTLERINREFGTTIIISEHRFEEVLPISDKVVVMNDGKITDIDTPEVIGSRLLNKNDEMFDAMPTPIKVYYSVCQAFEKNAPVTVKDGRKWLSDEMKRRGLEHSAALPPLPEKGALSDTAVEMKDVSFRYTKGGADILKDFSLSVRMGEFYAILGGNGAGKSTAISILSGINRPYRGKVRISDGLKMSVLPQNPQALFSQKTVELCLTDAARAVLKISDFSDRQSNDAALTERISNVVDFCGLGGLMKYHPFDLSGGEQQRAALAIVLLSKPDILVLDEATKGLDSDFKKKLADLLIKLCDKQKTVIAVSHDIEFCARYADRCALLFDGKIVSEGEPRKFFGGKSFYTTAANRMSRGLIDSAVLDEDIIRVLTDDFEDGKSQSDKPNFDKHSRTERGDNEPDYNKPDYNKPENETESEKAIEKNLGCFQTENADCTVVKNKRKLSALNIALGVIFSAAFGLTELFINKSYDSISFDLKYIISAIAAVVFLSGAILNFFPYGREISIPIREKNADTDPQKMIVTGVFGFVLVPLTIFVGMYFFGDRKYYFISLLIILEIMLPFLISFEKRMPTLREIVIISVLCTVGVVGRGAFAMLPQFKPVLAIVIISAVCFGCETGFLTGAVTAFVSNFFFGQGPWTPWQMFAFGTVGFLAGVVFKNGILRTTRLNLCVFGFLSAILIYGGIMNPSSVLIWQAKPNFNIFLSAYVMGFPFDLIHAVSTAFFLWFGAEPMCEKLERTKLKYGMYD